MKWQQEVDFIDLWKRYHAGTVSLGDMAKEIEAGLLKVVDSYPSKPMQDELLTIAHDFGSLALSDDPDIDTFDDLMERLYAFGDQWRALWINTQEWQR